jgi:hypothetical protein
MSGERKLRRPTRLAFGNPCFIIEPSERTNERSEFDVVRSGQSAGQVAANKVSSGAALKEGFPNAESGRGDHKQAQLVRSEAKANAMWQMWRSAALGKGFAPRR